MIRIYGFMDSRKDLLLFFFKGILVNKNCHGIDSWWHMFNGNSVVFKYLKDFPAETDLRVHHCFFNRNSSETVCSGNTGDRILRLTTGCFYDQSSLVLWCICILDVDRNTGFSYREDRILVEYAGSHVGKLTKFFICDGFDRFWIFYDSRIGNQETGNICPVLIQICLDCLGYERTGDIRAASWKCNDCSIFCCTVKSRDDCMLQLCKAGRQDLICYLSVESTVFFKSYNFCCIYKLVTKVGSHYLTVQELTTGSSIVGTAFCRKILLDHFKICIKRELQTETINNLLISCLDRCELFSEIFLSFCCSVAVI